MKINLLSSTLALSIVFGIAGVNASHAQSSTQNNLLPPYEEDLLRLVEIMGALEHLHPLCKQQAVGVWKAQMENIIKTEKPIPSRRAHLIATYNQSFNAFSSVHRGCSQTAEIVIDRYSREGREITARIATTYPPLPETPIAEPAAAETPAEPAG